MKEILQNESVISGRNAVKELLSSGRDIDKIYVQKGEREGSVKMLIGKASERKIPIIEAEKSKLDAMCGGAFHQGIAAMAAEHNYSTIEEILQYAESLGEKPFVVICDCVEDPHNLGAIIRNCDGAGVHGLIIPKRRSAGLTAVTARASAGAIEHLAIAKVSNIASTIEDLKKRGVWVVGCEANGEDYDSIDYDMPLALVLGSEGEGISSIVTKGCDFIASIPMAGKVNSLNVSCASAVIMFEAAKSRRKK